MWGPTAPTGFVWRRAQSAWMAAFVLALQAVPVRCVPDLPPRDRSGDPRPPGTWLLYDDVLEANDAAAADFELLAGIGPAKARALVESRRRADGFCSLEEIRAAAKLGSRWEGVARRLSVRPAPRCSSSSRG